MTLHEIKQAIANLSPSELAELAEWFANHQSDRWDERIAADSRAGRLDGLIARANADFEAGAATVLPVSYNARCARTLAAIEAVAEMGSKDEQGETGRRI